VGAGKQAQVTVACDCVVFDWLLQHAKAVHLGDSRYEAPTLTLDLSVPLLAAAGYLQAGSQPASQPVLWCCLDHAPPMPQHSDTRRHPPRGRQLPGACGQPAVHTG
jgi:hypothetical protein